MAPHAKTHKEPTFFRPWGAMGFPGGAGGKELICQCKRHKRHRFDTWVRMASHSSILAWRIPWTEEGGGLQSIALQRVRHDWSNLAHLHRDAIVNKKFPFHCFPIYYLRHSTCPQKWKEETNPTEEYEVIWNSKSKIDSKSLTLRKRSLYGLGPSVGVIQQLGVLYSYITVKILLTS